MKSGTLLRVAARTGMDRLLGRSERRSLIAANRGVEHDTCEGPDDAVGVELMGALEVEHRHLGTRVEFPCGLAAERARSDQELLQAQHRNTPHSAPQRWAEPFEVAPQDMRFTRPEALEQLRIDAY